MSTPATPSSPATPAERAALAAQLAQELWGLRDALVTLSLSLKDWQFEMDTGARQAAKLQVEQALASFGVSSAHSDKPGKS
jgi:hypothetical protein